MEKINSKIAVGLDIGTHKVCAIVSSHDENTGNLNILGIGITESEGLNRGVVVNIERTVNTIRKAIEQAEQQAGIKIEEVVVGIAGDHIESLQTRGIIGISNPNLEITKVDIDRLIEESRKVAIPSERKIIHIMPQDYIIDGQDGIIDPIGMSGVRLEANVHIVTGLKTAIQNIERCVERCGIKVKDVILEPLASSKAVLNEEEKEVGVALVDIGGGTTDIAIFEENVIRFTSVFGIAGRHVTDDIRKCLGIIAAQAEKTKKEYGHCYLPAIMHDEIIMIPGIAGRKPMEVAKSELCKIIQPRMEELFEFALAEIRRSGYAGKLGAGVVITGGTTLLKGAEELARDVFKMPVKIGIPSGLTYSGLAPEVESPVYSTCVGLALLSLEMKGSESANKQVNIANSQSALNSVIEIENDNTEDEIIEQNEINAKEDSSNQKENKVSFAQRMKKFIEEL